jgi:hypothetical protein
MGQAPEEGIEVTDGIRNARLWVCVNEGWVKITIPYKGVVHHSHGFPTDEGYRRSSVMWVHEGLAVRREHICHERDCDGLTTWGGVDMASLTELAELQLDGDWCHPDDVRDVIRPRWQGVEDFHRDHTAEAAGY